MFREWGFEESSLSSKVFREWGSEESSLSSKVFKIRMLGEYPYCSKSVENHVDFRK